LIFAAVRGVRNRGTNTLVYGLKDEHGTQNIYLCNWSCDLGCDYTHLDVLFMKEPGEEATEAAIKIVNESSCLMDELGGIARIIQSAIDKAIKKHNEPSEIAGIKVRWWPKEIVAMEDYIQYIRQLRVCIRDLVRCSQDGVRDHSLEMWGVELAAKPLRAKNPTRDKCEVCGAALGWFEPRLCNKCRDQKL